MPEYAVDSTYGAVLQWQHMARGWKRRGAAGWRVRSIVVRADAGYSSRLAAPLASGMPWWTAGLCEAAWVARRLLRLELHELSQGGWSHVRTEQAAFPPLAAIGEALARHGAAVCLGSVSQRRSDAEHLDLDGLYASVD